jgi:hypothetical protein
MGIVRVTRRGGDQTGTSLGVQSPAVLVRSGSVTGSEPKNLPSGRSLKEHVAADQQTFIAKETCMEVVLLFLSFLFFLLAVLFMLLMNGGQLPFFKSKTLPTREEISKLAADEFAKEYAKYREEAIRRGK